MRRIISILLCLSMLAGLLSICCSAEDSLPFADVRESDWFYPAVAEMYENRILYGTDSEHFSPDATATRAMVVSVLYRLEGRPEAGECPFEDVAEDAYYHNAVAWGAENGIVYGTDAEHFSPNDPVTREQLITFLYRYVKYKGSACSQRSNLNAFEDVSRISGYAVKPTRWAVAVGVIHGRSGTQLAPRGNTTRAELAQMLYGLRSKVLSDSVVFDPETAEVPVLMFHGVVQENPNAYSITAETFEEIIAMLSESGYHSIDIQTLVDYADGTGELPEKPILITFDDGYSNNIEYACPILQKYGFRAVICVIGCYVGLDEYNGKKISSHFSLEEAAQYIPSVISIQAHTNKMHMLRDYPNLADGRCGVGQRSSESDEEYYAALVQDFEDCNALIAQELEQPMLLAYPYGAYTKLSEKAAKAVGYRCTLTTRRGINVITKGNADSLYLLNRINMTQSYTAEEFAELVASCAYD